MVSCSRTDLLAAVFVSSKRTQLQETAGTIQLTVKAPALLHAGYVLHASGCEPMLHDAASQRVASDCESGMSLRQGGT